jgi:hypothetical protein
VARGEGSKLQVKAEGMNRASTEAQFEEMDEGPGALLWRLCQAENDSIVRLFGDVEDHNLVLDYPILSRKDEKRQADITKVQTGGNGWVSVNEARRDNGKEPLPLKVADDVLIATSKGPVPLSALEVQYYGDKNPDDEGGQDSQEGGGEEKSDG